MASGNSDNNDLAALPSSVKILIAGGFGVGKTTMVGALSEIKPLRTEELLSALSAGVDDLVGVEGKTTTTVALDFGKITINPQLVLYLFGTPGQERFWFMWDELCLGALGVVVLADTRRLEDSFAAVDFFESRDVPFVLAVNAFDEAPVYRPDEVQDALDLDPDVPIVLCDVRDRESSKEVLATLIRYLVSRRLTRPAGALR